MGGKAKKTIPRKCERCKKEFWIAPGDLKHKPGRFCSRQCSNWGRHDKTPEERFLALLTKEPNGCWVWKSKTMYPKFWIGTKRVKAHHWSYINWHGPLEHGKEVNHSCDNPRCVNPSHLYLATHKKNMKDAGIKGKLAWVSRLECDRDRYKNLYLKTEQDKDELAKRLKKACEMLRDPDLCQAERESIANWLEAMPDEDGK